MRICNFAPGLTRFISALATALAVTGLRVIAGENTAQVPNTSTVSFSHDIAPILVAKCQTCHGPEKAKGGYRLHTFGLLMKGGESKEKPIIPGKPQESELYRLITALDEDDRMPQKDDPLPQAQIGLIERWIQEGSRFDGPDTNAFLITMVPQAPNPAAPEKYPQPVPVFALAFSPDGGELATGGYHEIMIWDAAAGRLLRRIGNLAQRTQGLVYHPDGSLLVAATGTPGRAGEIVLMDPAGARVTKRLAGASDVMIAVAFSRDGKQLAAGGADNSIRLYDMPQASERRVIQQHADWVVGLAFNHDGTRIVSASRDRTARVFNTMTGDLETTYTGHETPLSAVAFTGDDKLVYSAGRDKKIHCWNAADGKKTNEIAGFSDDILNFILPDQNIYTCSADKLVREYSAKDRKLLRTFSGQNDWVYSISYCNQTKRLASGSFAGEVRIWNTEDGSGVLTFTASPGF